MMNASRFKQLMSTRHAKLALRFFTYGVMAVSTILLTSLAIFYAMGYRFNQSNLTIEQGGLAQLRSTPESATVYVDGKLKADLKTPSRAYLTAGKHSVQMHLDGYDDWKRDFDLQAGQLLWLDYARLVPSKLTTTPQRALAGLADAQFSPDRRWLILNEAANKPAFTLFDLSDETKPSSSALTIPADQLTQVAGQTDKFSIIEWDFGSRDVLVRHDIGDVHEILRIDRTKSDSAVNISRLFGLNIDEVHFAGGNQSIVYAQTSGVLRRLDIDSSTASAALVDGLRSFVVYGDDRLAFVADRQLTAKSTTPRRVVGIYQNGKEVLVRDYDPNAIINIALTEYFRHQYLAINGSAGQVEVLQDPADKATETPTYAKFDIGKQVQWLTFSSNGRMIAAGNGNSWTTYDLEVAQTYAATLSGADVTKPLKWLDDYYLWTSDGGAVRIVEFDGLNGHTIATAAGGYTVSLSQNGKSIFSFNKPSADAIFQSTRMVTN